MKIAYRDLPAKCIINFENVLKRFQAQFASRRSIEPCRYESCCKAAVLIVVSHVQDRKMVQRAWLDGAWEDQPIVVETVARKLFQAATTSST